jgi:hypothetical protein
MPLPSYTASLAQGRRLDAIVTFADASDAPKSRA